MTNELWRWGAADLARAIRAREISSREAVESYLARIEAVNPRVNAIVDLMADEAVMNDRADHGPKYVIPSEVEGPGWVARETWVFSPRPPRSLDSRSG